MKFKEISEAPPEQMDPDYARSKLRALRDKITGKGSKSKDKDPKSNAQDKDKKVVSKAGSAKTAQPSAPVAKKQSPGNTEFPKSTAGVQLNPGDTVTYTNQAGQTKKASVNKMLNTRDKQGDLQIQLKMGNVTFAIDRDNISAANGKPWKFRE